MAVITYRQIAKPLERLERVASTVRETKNYDLRVKHNSTDDSGRVASAFDDMLAELASARDRERVEQSELARTTRLTTMGAMTASIAHEINQPLTAIVANGQAAQRWLSNAPPDLAETRAALMKIVEDGRRAGNIIESVRGMFKKDSGERDLIDVDEIALNVLALVKSEIRTKGISVQTDMPKNLPQVLAGRTQLQQVIMNLTMNAIEAMDAVASREKMLEPRKDAGDKVGYSGSSKRSHNCGGHWNGNRSSGSKSPLRTIIYDKIQWHGHGLVHMPFDY
jgi:C4-dicarboxylate-specific signal transduction histidine kinase